MASRAETKCFELTETERQEDIKRWRTFLALDPDKPPAYEDILHVNQITSEMWAGRRPDLVPRSYKPHWPLHPDAPRPEAAKERSGYESGVPVSEISKVSITNNDNSGEDVEIDPEEGFFHADYSLESNPHYLPWMEAMKAEFEAPFISFEEFSKEVDRMREKHEQELQTKDGRAKWEKYESGEFGNPPPAFYKKMRQLQASERLESRIDWNMFQAAAKEYKQRVAAGKDKPPVASSAGKGKSKKGKR